MSIRYKKSEEWLERALKTIPLGSQTFSKSKASLPYGVSPYFVERAKGSRFWDIDGNGYIDFVNGLACVILGYCDPDVDAAVRKQMESGVTFSLPHALETEVAELLVHMVPCAEKVRFGKNGTDATSAAIRIARGYTGRDRVAVCGYHGWQDWYIGTTSRDLGVPQAVKDLSHKFTYNDPASLQALLERHPGEFAAVILEPMNSAYPKDRFLQQVRDQAHSNGALMIFDETITGFRYSRGGAQEEFGVIPDLATFGKGLANGYPLSAVVGRREYMDVIERIFFSGTFGGETLSLAAAKSTLTKILSEPVVDTLKSRGQSILQGVQQIISDMKIEPIVQISGHPSWTFLSFKEIGGCTPLMIKTLFIQEVFKRGIFALGTHNISYAHDETDIKTVLDCYREVFHLIKASIDGGSLAQRLECTPMPPIFVVR